MGSKKEKKPTIGELARDRIVNLYKYEGKELLLICDAAIKGQSLNHLFVALHRTGITIYEYNEKYENKIISLETHSWDEWNEVLIDHFFINSTLDFKGSNGSWSIKISSDGKEAQQVIGSYTDIEIETVSRPWYKKIVGFRSWKTWKMITATSFYAILLFSIIEMSTSPQTDDTLATIAMIATFLAFLGLFFGLINPKIVLPFASHKHRKRVAQIYGTSILIAIIMFSIFTPVQQTEQNAATIKGETTSEEKNPTKIDAVEDKNENSEKKDNEAAVETNNENKVKTDAKVNEEKNKDKEVVVASTTTKPKKEEQAKNPSGVELDSAVVTRVVDGDTLKVEINGKEETVRLILVDTPETKHPQLGVQPFGPEASAFTESSLNGKEIGLEKDVSDRDRYGRLLRYVWVDGELFNQQLIEKGLARVAIYQPDVKYIDQFRPIQQKAQQEGIGIWSIENYAQEDGYHVQQEKPTPKETAKPEVKKEPKPQPKEEPKTNSGSCNIKGNISSSGEKIYHVPGGQFYEITNPEEVFCSTGAAESAGYRASKR